MKERNLFFLILFTFSTLTAQEADTLKKEIQAVNITGQRNSWGDRITEKKLNEKNLGQDIPSLLKHTTSVINTSDAGADVGYTKIRVRGIDQSQIQVALNGVPINDAESQSPFWINIPDIASSLSSITLQKGTEGAGSFGASISLKLDSPSNEAYFQTDQSIGSFNTHKHTFNFGTGYLWEDKIKIDGRVSFIKSDGYIDRAFSNLFSYYGHALFIERNSQIGFMVLGGNEKTYQSWNGIDEKIMKERRTFNSSGAIYDDSGNIIDFYNNETDNYKQNHYHLYWNQKFNDKWELNSTIFLTPGKGYYEEYRQDQNLNDYKLSTVNIGSEVIGTTDLIRRQEMKNYFYGIVNSLTGKGEIWDIETGLNFNIYDGEHFGKVIWSKYSSNGAIGHKYYSNKAKKEDFSIYSKILYKLNSYLQFNFNLFYKNITYKGKDNKGGESVFKYGGVIDFNKDYNFLMPEIGVLYKINKGKINLTYGLSQKEPNREDILNNKDIKSELLHDIELGASQSFGKFLYSVNGYGMYYVNQLVLSGRVNDVGSYIRENSGKSFRAGLEVSVHYKINPSLDISLNSTFSSNKNIDYNKETEQELINLGDTPLAYSPNYIGNFIISWQPVKNVTIKWSNQYVSSQYLSNEKPNNGRLDPYFISDVFAEYNPKLFNLKNFSLKLMLNNIFNNKYESNGYYYEDIPYYYPQAGFNFLTGISIKI